MSDLKRDDSKRPNKRLYLTLPLPPSVNHMYVNTKFGGRRLTKRADIFIAQAKALINDAIQEQYYRREENNVWLYVDMVIYMPDKRIRDSHNLLKLLLDVMQGIVFDNDYYAMPRIQSVEYDKGNPRAEIIVHTQSKLSRESGMLLFNKK